jgi:pimeloyl-ACP methyl ester carboxylesterase
LTSITQNGYHFEYVERGSGEPVVLVHGSASDYRTWQAQQDEFAQHFRTIRYSRRYHWPNDKIIEGADYSMTEHVEDLRALLRSLNATPAHLVGHSYGAFVCLLLAMREPGLVQTLALAEPPAITLFVSNQPKPAEILRLLVSRPRTAIAILNFGSRGVTPATEALQQDDRETALRLFGRATLGREAFDRLSKSRFDQVRDNFIKAELLGSGFAPLNAGELRTLQVPTLLLNGQESPRLFHRLMDRVEELLPHARRVEIPSAGHIMHEDNPAAYNEAVLSFLTAHRMPAPQPVPQAVLVAG